MQYYSTNHKAPKVSLRDAVIKGLSPDKGLYMPEAIHPLPQTFFDHIEDLSLQEIAFEVAKCFFGEDVPADDLKAIVYDTLQFDIPLVKVKENIYALEVYHGPTAAFKDVGARFMARLLSYFVKKESTKREIHVLVATSGDTGSAVANGFLGVPGIKVCVLYPKGKVSAIQEKQFTTLGQNITALEVDGVFDDCQRLVKEAFMDEDLNRNYFLTSANSINVARFLPQAFYYFYAYAQLKKVCGDVKPVMCVPSGNFGNICAGLFGYKMGLPVKRFIAANNANDIFYNYLQTGKYQPRCSVQTLANAMDVGDPSNFARIVDLFSYDAEPQEGAKPNSETTSAEKAAQPAVHDAICKVISGAAYQDSAINAALENCLNRFSYLLDPHGACGYMALQDGLEADEIGIFLETAHPAKFKDVVEAATETEVQIPDNLQRFMAGRKQSLPLTKDFADFKQFIQKNF